MTWNDAMTSSPPDSRVCAVLTALPVGLEYGLARFGVNRWWTMHGTQLRGVVFWASLPARPNPKVSR